MVKQSISCLLAIALAGVGCTRSDRAEPVTGKGPHHATGNGDVETPTDRENHMPQGTPAGDGEAWKRAEAIAAAHVGRNDLRKRTDELPYLFMARGTRGVLVHQGKVVTGTGPAVAGAYLRDIGIIEGPGPGIDAVMDLLYALQALPKVDDLSEEGYFDSPHADMKALAPRVERDAGEARVVLHYFLPQSAIHRPDLQQLLQGSRVGGPEPQPVARLTLAIRPQGDAAWQRDHILWTPPAP
jgi:hypothetical protein